MEAGIFPDIGDGESINNLVNLSGSQVSTTEQEARISDDQTQLSIVAPGKDQYPADEQVQTDKTDMKIIRKMVGPMKKTLNQLSRKTSNSIWILAYIAIVTTWPFAGFIFSFIFKKKFKNILPKSVSHNQ